MPPTSVDVTKYIIGAAEVYYRTPGVLTAWNSVGLTKDNPIFAIERAMSNPSQSLNAIRAKLRGLDYESSGGARVEFTLPEMSGPKLALAIPGAVETLSAITDAGGTPLSTTLAAAAAIGDTTIKVTAITNAAVGDYIRINVAGALAEYRQITFVGTAGAGGTGLGFRDPLLKAHANGVAVVETVGDGKSEITASLARRQPMSAYYDWALVAQSPADYYELILYRGISSTEEVSFEFTDEADEVTGIRVTIEGRADETNLAAPVWKLRAPAA